VNGWAIIFYAFFVASVIYGGPHWRIFVVMIANFAASMALKDYPTAIAVADLAAAAFLLGAGQKAHIVAFLFACMVPIYWASTVFPQWPNSLTYVIIEFIAYFQLGVISYGGGGIAFIRRHRVLRRGAILGPVAFGGHANVGVAMVSQESA
jgi:hypothetical protein